MSEGGAELASVYCISVYVCVSVCAHLNETAAAVRFGASLNMHIQKSRKLRSNDDDDDDISCKSLVRYAAVLNFK